MMKQSVGKKPSVIEINGRRYNAITGQPIGHTTAVIDGIKKDIHPKPMMRKAAKHLRQSAHAVHTRTQRSKTLMREVVAKPRAKRNNPSTTSQPRVARAASVPKSPAIRHFSKHGKAEQPLHGEVIHSRQSTSAVALAAPLPNVLAGLSHQRLEKMLDAALLSADAQKRALRVRRLPRWLVATLAVVVVAVGGTLFAWKNIPQASMKVAGLKAHINSSVPAYVPSDFKFAGPVESHDGTASMTYRSASNDGQSFTIKQQASNWDSSTLEANIPKSQVQTSQVKGTTVYIYGANNNATWVNNGIRYTIEDNAQLNSGELLKVADSL